MEPSVKLLYYGANIKTMGGCNFHKIEKEINRNFDTITNNTIKAYPTIAPQYELPYYKWEADLDFNGRGEDSDATGSWIATGWRGFYTVTGVPNENYLMHVRMKK
jgi:hypothetical protein